MKFHYVYILRSLLKNDRYYVGMSGNLEERLKYHNDGKCRHTSKFRPWQIENAIAFRSKEKAANFEKYLKNHSGRAFRKKHF